jgi:hypothetical protein
MFGISLAAAEKRADFNIAWPATGRNIWFMPDKYLAGDGIADEEPSIPVRAVVQLPLFDCHSLAPAVQPRHKFERTVRPIVARAHRRAGFFAGRARLSSHLASVRPASFSDPPKPASRCSTAATAWRETAAVAANQAGNRRVGWNAWVTGRMRPSVPGDAGSREEIRP